MSNSIKPRCEGLNLTITFSTTEDFVKFVATIGVHGDDDGVEFAQWQAWKQYIYDQGLGPDYELAYRTQSASIR